MLDKDLFNNDPKPINNKLNEDGGFFDKNKFINGKKMTNNINNDILINEPDFCTDSNTKTSVKSDLSQLSKDEIIEIINNYLEENRYSTQSKGKKR